MTKLIVRQAVNKVNTASSAVEDLRTSMNDIASQLPEYPVILTIKGVGTSLGPQLMAEIGVSHDVLVVLGLFSIFQWEIDSAFIAAILTVVGYSINDTIVIFDRIRERLRANRREGRAELVDISIMQTLNRSVNTVVTSLFPLVALFFLGGESIKIFVLVMLLGFIVGAYSSICVAGPVWYDINNARSSSSKG